jgi:hypothetical protein
LIRRPRRRRGAIVRHRFPPALSNAAGNAAEIATLSGEPSRACGKIAPGTRLFRDDSHKKRGEDCYTFEPLTGDSKFSALSSSSTSGLKRI